MNSRIERYEAFLEEEYIEGLLKSHEYSLVGVTSSFREWAKGGVRRILFTGMGCSAIVSDLVRGYLIQQSAGLDIFVINDYDFFSLVPEQVIFDEGTLIVVSSYSGHSREPLLAAKRLQRVRDRMLFLTSGGPLASYGEATATSVARWELSTPDREYPLFHVTQYFSILLDMFGQLGIIPTANPPDLKFVASRLCDRRREAKVVGKSLASGAQEASLLLLAQPFWHDCLLKLCKMHLNEIAMVPASRNYFHEFCHSEVAVLSDPTVQYAVLAFTDESDDDYTRAKLEHLVTLLTSDAPQNHKIRSLRVEMYGESYLEKLFWRAPCHSVHDPCTFTIPRSVVSRFISEASGNSWYHSATIAAELA